MTSKVCDKQERLKESPAHEAIPATPHSRRRQSWGSHRRDGVGSRDITGVSVFSPRYSNSVCNGQGILL